MSGGLDSPQRLMTIAKLVLVAVLLVAACSALAAAFLLARFRQLEERTTHRKAEQVRFTIRDELKSLETLAVHWALWDDTYRFVADHNQAFVDSNFSPSMADTEMDICAILNTTGKVIICRTPPQDRVRLPVLARELQEAVASDPALRDTVTGLTAASGIVNLPTAPVLLTIQPIRRTNGQGPIRGSLLMAREIDAPMVERIEKQLQSPLVLRRPNDPALPPDMREAWQALDSSVGAEEVVRVLSGDRIAGYLLVSDLHGYPVLVARAELDRSIYRFGRDSIRTLLVVLLVVGVSLGCLLFEAVRRLLITELRQHAVEARYRSLLEISSEGVGLFDGTGRLQTCNDQLAALFGRTSAEMLASPSDSGANAELAQMFDALRRSQRHESLAGIELGIRHADGSDRTIECSLSPVYDERGQYSGGILVARDTTQRRADEEKLHYRVRLEELLAEISAQFVKAPPEATADLIDAALRRIGTFLGVDRAYYCEVDQERRTTSHRFGWSAEGVAGRDAICKDRPLDSFPWWISRLSAGHAIRLASLDDLPESAEPERQCLRELEVQSTLAVPLMVDAQLVGFLGLDAVRAPQAWQPEDVSLLKILGEVFVGALERQRVELAVHEGERRLAALVANITDIVLVVNGDGAIDSVCPSVERLLGWSPSELVGRPYLELVHPDDLASVSPGRQSGSDGGYHPTTLRVRHRSGEYRTFQCVAQATAADSPLPGVIVTAHDVTDLHLLEDRLRQAQKLEALGQLAGGVAHDFNNVLAAVLGNAQLLADDLNDDPEVVEQLGEILEAGERGTALVRQLLAFSRRQMLQPRRLDLNEVITTTSKMLRRLISEDVELIPELAPEVAPVMADRGQVEQILINLAVNARDAMPVGGRLTIATANTTLDSVSLAGDENLTPGSYVMLSVSDTGSGMDETVRQRVFEPFFTTKEVGRGTGLGLATVYGIVMQSGGYIDVESAPHRGATFRIYLPAVDGSTADDDEARRPETTAGSETILVVEDAHEVRTVVCRILSRSGYRVVTAAGAAEATEMFRADPSAIDLLLTDVIMPGGGGRELAEQLQALNPNLAVLFMSGYTDDALIRQGVAVEQVAFLSKPFTHDDLLGRVREVLDRHAERLVQ